MMILGIRECFVPRPGYLFAFADYDGLELRTMAQVCKTVLGASALADSLNSGADPHCQVAAKILDRPYDEVRRAYKAGADHPDYPEVYQKRQMGKVANFGFPGGLGARRLVEYAAGPKYRVAITEDEARGLKETWLQAFPEFRDYFRYADSLQGGEPFAQIFSGRLRGGASFTELANSLFQGLGADATKAAGYALTRECRIGSGPLRGGHPICYVHDEFWCEVREAVAHEAAHQMAEIMRAAADQFLPDVPTKAEPGLARRWSKNAKPKIEDGRLIPWDG